MTRGEHYNGIIFDEGEDDEGVEEGLNSADFAEWVIVRARELRRKVRAPPYFETQQRTFIPETDEDRKKRINIEMEEGA